MRQTLAAAIAALILAGPAVAADAALGMWKTQPDDNGRFAHVELYPCDGAICGVIRAAFNADGSPRTTDAVGKRMLWDMTPDGGSAYAGGKIWAPDRDKVYASKMALAGDTLSVSGCVLVICREQVWSRLK